jgi:hypothetical protein
MRERGDPCQFSLRLGQFERALKLLQPHSGFEHGGATVEIGPGWLPPIGMMARDFSDLCAQLRGALLLSRGTNCVAPRQIAGRHGVQVDRSGPCAGTQQQCSKSDDAEPDN